MRNVFRGKYISVVLGVFLFLLSWQTFHFIRQDPAIVSLGDVLCALMRITSKIDFYENTLATMKIVFSGITVAVISGVFLGVAIDFNHRIKYLISPLIEMLRNIPSITLFPILLVIYGIGDEARIFVIFWTSVPAVVLSTVYGLRTVDKSVVEASQIDGGNSVDIMARIKIPLAFPEILNGIKIGVGNGFVAIVVAEMLGASKGLGFMVLWTTNSFKYDETYAYIISIALVGGLFNLLMGWLIKQYERRIV